MSAAADDWPDILVIDDEAGQLEEMRDLVASLGYRCHSVQSGEAGIDLLRAQSRIGVVILDLYMPAGPGLDVLKRLRGDPDMPPRLQYLLITGRPLVEDAIEGLDLGAMTVLVKPVSVVSLRRSLTEACRRFLNAHSQAPARTGFREQIQALMAVTQHDGQGPVSAAVPGARAADDPGEWAYNLPGRLMRRPASDRADTVEALWYLRRMTEQVASLQAALGRLALSVKALRILSVIVQAHIEGWRMPVSALAAATDIPQTTALRHLEELNDLGFVERRPDPTDKRRLFIALTAYGETRLSEAVAEFLNLDRPAEAREDDLTRE